MWKKARETPKAITRSMLATHPEFSSAHPTCCVITHFHAPNGALDEPGRHTGYGGLFAGAALHFPSLQCPSMCPPPEQPRSVVSTHARVCTGHRDSHMNG